MPKLDELIEDVHKISESSMFDTPVDKLLAACEKLLIFSGYSVAEPVDFDLKINKLSDLITKFYGLLHHKYPNTVRNHINVKKDLSLAKQLCESRMIDGTSKEVALNECGEIIHTLFAYEKEFKLKYPIRDFGVLGQGNVGWITDKALQIMNNMMRGNYEDILEEKMEKTLANADPIERDFGVSEEMLRRVEGNNGEEKESR